MSTPLTQASVSALFSWTQSSANTGFKATTQGQDSLTFGANPPLSGTAGAYVGQVIPLQFTLAASATNTIDLTNVSNLITSGITLAYVYGICFTTVGGAVSLSPGASNGLTWFFTGTSPVLAVNDGGVQLYYSPSGTAVSSSHKTLTFTAAGTLTSGYSVLTCTLAIFGA